MSEYWKKLKDPRWQRKRLEVLELADFTCEQCGSKTETLHAHHKIYRKGREPWEYELWELSCLCDSCHETWHMLKDVISELLVELDETGIRALAGYGQALSLEAGASAYSRIGSTSAMRAFGHRFGLTEEEVTSIKDEDLCVWLKDVLASAAASKTRKKKK